MQKGGLYTRFFCAVKVMLKKDEVCEPFYKDKLIIQNTKLYRFTSDSILLSRFARAKVGDNVADFCSGSGVIGFHFLCLNPQIRSLTFFEMQKELAEMYQWASRRLANLFMWNLERIRNAGESEK